MNFMIKWNRNKEVLEIHWPICANIAVRTCGNLERGLESEAVWEIGEGDIFQIIPPECFITRCLHMTYII